MPGTFPAMKHPGREGDPKVFRGNNSNRHARIYFFNQNNMLIWSHRIDDL